MDDATRKERRLIQIFIASPGDLREEREKFAEVVAELNQIKANPMGLQLEPLGWKEVPPGAGRPQALINEEVVKCDLFVLLLWKRWGMPSGEKSSGTEEEFELACRLRLERPDVPEIMLYFKEVAPAFLEDPGEQLQKVLAFREKIEREHTFFYQMFADAAAWEDIFKKHLSRWLDKLAEAPALDLSAGRPQNESPRDTAVVKPAARRLPPEPIETPRSRFYFALNLRFMKMVIALGLALVVGVPLLSKFVGPSPGGEVASDDLVPVLMPPNLDYLQARFPPSFGEQFGPGPQTDAPPRANPRITTPPPPPLPIEPKLETVTLPPATLREPLPPPTPGPTPAPSWRLPPYVQTEFAFSTDFNLSPERQPRQSGLVFSLEPSESVAMIPGFDRGHAYEGFDHLSELLAPGSRPAPRGSRAFMDYGNVASFAPGPLTYGPDTRGGTETLVEFGAVSLYPTRALEVSAWHGSLTAEPLRRFTSDYGAGRGHARSSAYDLARVYRIGNNGVYSFQSYLPADNSFIQSSDLFSRQTRLNNSFTAADFNVAYEPGQLVTVMRILAEEFQSEQRVVYGPPKQMSVRRTAEPPPPFLSPPATDALAYLRGDAPTLAGSNQNINYAMQSGVRPPANANGTPESLFRLWPTKGMF
jgi:hypothetical protein